MRKFRIKVISVAVIAVACVLALGTGMRTARADAPPPGKAILFVHGYHAACTYADGGPDCNEDTLVSIYGPFLDFLAASGYTVYHPVLPGNDNIVNAQFIHDYIAGLNLGYPVKVLAHSMGGLSARYCEKYIAGCEAMISEDIALDSPETGALEFCLNADNDGGQMCPSSDFMTALNTPDATPGNGPWVQFYGPVNTTKLSGMDCYVSVPRKYDHTTFLFQPDVQANILITLEGGCPSTKPGGGSGGGGGGGPKH